MKRENSSKMPVYVLSASLVISSIVYANQAQSASQYVTTQQYKKDLTSLIIQIESNAGDVRDFKTCVNRALNDIQMASNRTNWRLILGQC